MYQRPDRSGHTYARRVSGSLLPESVRRDVADLNRRFLQLVFSVTEPEEPCVRLLRLPVSLSPEDSETVDAMAACPFTLFELRLDDLAPDPAIHAGARVRDERRAAPSVADLQCQALAHGALMLAWQLADRSPLSLRLTLGLSSGAELLLNATRVTGLAAWARKPGLLCTRWPDHPVFWSGLLESARRRDPVALNRSHCLGLTLLVAELGMREFDATPTRHGGSRSQR